MPIKAVVVERPFLKPDIRWPNKVTFSMNVISCLSTNLSKIFERAGKMETGRKGDSTLGIGDIRAIFQSDGKVDVSIQAFIICVNGEARSLATHLMNVTGI